MFAEWVWLSLPADPGPVRVVATSLSARRRIYVAHQSRPVQGAAISHFHKAERAYQQRSPDRLAMAKTLLLCGAPFSTRFELRAAATKPSTSDNAVPPALGLAP